MKRAAAIAVFVLLHGRPAAACSMPSPQPYALTAPGIERAPPLLDRATAGAIKRGQGPTGGCGGQTATSCDDIGTFAIEVAGRDETSTEVGFVFELVRGALPSGVTLPTDPVRATEGRVTFPFIDGADDEQEKLAFTLRVVAVDASNNRSEPREVTIAHEGSSGGCAWAGRGRGSFARWTLVTAAAMLLFRRRGSFHLGR